MLRADVAAWHAEAIRRLESFQPAIEELRVALAEQAILLKEIRALRVVTHYHSPAPPGDRPAPPTGC